MAGEIGSPVSLALGPSTVIDREHTICIAIIFQARHSRARTLPTRSACYGVLGHLCLTMCSGMATEPLQAPQQARRAAGALLGLAVADWVPLQQDRSASTLSSAPTSEERLTFRHIQQQLHGTLRTLRYLQCACRAFESWSHSPESDGAFCSSGFLQHKAYGTFKHHLDTSKVATELSQVGAPLEFLEARLVFAPCGSQVGLRRLSEGASTIPAVSSVCQNT